MRKMGECQNCISLGMQLCGQRERIRYFGDRLHELVFGYGANINEDIEDVLDRVRELVEEQHETIRAAHKNYVRLLNELKSKESMIRSITERGDPITVFVRNLRNAPCVCDGFQKCISCRAKEAWVEAGEK